MRVLAFSGHTETQAPHAVQSSLPFPLFISVPMPSGHTETQAPHPMHLRLYQPTTSSCLKPSGLEHHLHLSGQPAMNIFVLIPSPSLTEKGCICII
jgi:hypothetical protein